MKVLKVAMEKVNHLIITLDGPAGAGKSTVAKSLSKRLGITYLDTGAMYRALTLKALRQKINLEDEEALTNLAQHTVIDYKEMPDGSLNVTLDGQDVSKEIRSLDVTNNTFYAAKTAGVREIMVKWQREIGYKRSLVTDGRDQGTIVFPDANYKFYIDANIEERARRRLKELQEAGKQMDIAQMKKEIQERDNKDLTRSVGPLKKADDAIVIDSTGMTIEDNVDAIMKHIK